jgi:hypothetical protein
MIIRPYRLIKLFHVEICIWRVCSMHLRFSVCARQKKRGKLRCIVPSLICYDLNECGYACVGA